jgi:hypothetical protein
MPWYRRTHPCVKVAKTAAVRLSTKLANHSMCVTVGVAAGMGGVGACGVPEVFELATWSW